MLSDAHQRRFVVSGWSKRSEIKKTLHLLLIGQLYGLHTLHQILDSHGIRSNRWSKVYKCLTLNEISSIVSKVLQTALREKVVDLARKSESTWSRSEVTVVFDDSIFKQWLSAEMKGEEKDRSDIYFGKYYSGQIQRTVYGFRVTVIGVCLGDTFYPFDLRLSSKAEDTKKTSCLMLRSLHEFLWQITQKTGVSFPNLFLSADSGFDSLELLDTCDELSQKMSLMPICVPRTNNKIEICGQQMSISEAIKDGYIELEKQEKCSNEPYLIRCRVKLCKYNREVTMLFFRLKEGRNISVIYTPDPNIKAKTLRRRWFQRTQIEQFFRLLKDTLKIQQAKVTSKEGFERKLWVFVFQALNCLLFRNFCRAKFRYLKGWGFARIRQRIIAQGIEKDWFRQEINSK